MASAAPSGGAWRWRQPRWCCWTNRWPARARGVGAWQLLIRPGLPRPMLLTSASMRTRCSGSGRPRERCWSNGRVIASGSQSSAPRDARSSGRLPGDRGRVSPLNCSRCRTCTRRFRASSQVLFGADLTVAEGEIDDLLGRNGMGKTTLVHAHRRPLPETTRSGVRFNGAAIDGEPPPSRTLASRSRARRAANSPTSRCTSTWRRSTGRHALEPGACTVFPRWRAARPPSATSSPAASSRCWPSTRPRHHRADPGQEPPRPGAAVRREVWRALRRCARPTHAMLVLITTVRPAAWSPLADRHVILEKGRVVAEAVQAAGRRPRPWHPYLGVQPRATFVLRARAA